MIVVVDYGMGNLGSILNAIKKVGGNAIVSSNISDVEKADKLILPGVGAFDNGMKNINDLGLIPVLNEKVLAKKTPVLGICLGMQLLTKRSEEGCLAGFGWVDAETVKFKFEKAVGSYKVPHMGWNSVRTEKKSKILHEMYEEPRFYFVHSYYVKCNNKDDILLSTNYGYDFTSAVERENIAGVQFHPEKSHKFGLKIFENFVGG